MPVTFIHAADLHLDSPLRGLAEYEGAPVDRIRLATREALENLVSLAIDRDVAFVVVAGDVWDGANRDVRSAVFFASQMARLGEAGIGAYLVLGNHDALSRIPRAVETMANVHWFPSDEAQTHTFQAGGVKIAVHGRSFGREKVDENFAATYPQAVAGALNIGVLHTSLGGYAGHENYAPCRPADLLGKNYDYWALGHVHSAQKLDYAAHGAAAYSGVLQGRHARETGPKGAYVVSLDGGGASLEFVACDTVRWSRVEVDAAGAATLGELAARVRDEAGRLLAGGNGDKLTHAVRVVVTGATALHGMLQYCLRQFRNQVAVALSTAHGDRVYMEKIVLKTAAPGAAADVSASDASLGDLRRLLNNVAGNREFREKLANEVAHHVAELPPEAADLLAVGSRTAEIGANGAHLGEQMLARHLSALADYAGAPEIGGEDEI